MRINDDYNVSPLTVTVDDLVPIELNKNNQGIKDGTTRRRGKKEGPTYHNISPQVVYGGWSSSVKVYMEL